ncbi:reverse transcriptase domain-containing protein [Tanacetum coccineum]
MHGAIKIHTPRGIGTLFSTYEPDKIKEGQHKLKEASHEATKGILSCADAKERIIITRNTWSKQSSLESSYQPASRRDCFLDAYKGYHQIQMAEGDEEKTAFFIREGAHRDVTNGYSPNQRRILGNVPHSLRRKHKRSVASRKRKKVDSYLLHELDFARGKTRPMIKQYVEKSKEILKSFNNYSMEHVWRDQNKKADALSKLSSMTFLKLAKEVLVEVVYEQSIVQRVVADIIKVEEDNWMLSIREYLQFRILPSDPQRARKLRIKAPLYKMIDDKLYRKTAISVVKDHEAKILLAFDA